MPKKSSNNLSLAGFGDIFTASTGGEQISMVPLSELHPPEFHPFQVNDDEAMKSLAESVKMYGVREPGLARKRTEGSYELLCGNRRKRACELSGISVMPVIIRELDDDSAAIAMVDSNLQQREKLLLSEKAWAYRVKMEALNHNGIKGENHSFQIMVEQTGESKNQIYRLIRLTELVPALLDKVDVRQLAFNPAVELSYLSRKEQAIVVDAMAKYEVKPSLSQAVRLKKLSQDRKLTSEVVEPLLSEEKKPPKSTERVSYSRFFPPDYSAKQIDAVIIKLLTDWKEKVSA